MKALLLSVLILGSAIPLALGALRDPSVCQSDEEKSVNDVAGLPRYNIDGSEVSNNIGTYDLFDCTTTNGKRTCDILDLGDVKVEESPKSSTDIANYLQGVAAYAAFAAFMFFALIVYGFTFCAMRYCCRCCGCCGTWCSGGCCGKRFPTRVPEENTCDEKLCGCCGGIEWNPDLQQPAYSSCQRWTARIYMIIFVVCVTLFILLGHFKGTLALTDALSSLNDGPSGVVNNIRGGTATPVKNALTSMSSDAFSNLLVGMNNTFMDPNNVDLSVVQESLECAIDSIDTFPNIGTISTNIDGVQSSIDGVRASIGRMDNELNDLDNTNNLVLSSVASTASKVQETQLLLQNFRSGADPFRNDVNELVALTDSLAVGNAAYSIPSISSDVTAVSNNVPNSTDVYEVTLSHWASLDRVQNQTINLDIAERTELIYRLIEVNTTYAALPDMSVTADNMDSFNTKLSEVSQKIGSVDAVMDSMQSDLASIVSSYGTLNASAYNFKDTVAPVVDIIDNFNVELKLVNNSLDSMSDNLQTVTTELDKIENLRAIEPCANQMVDEIKNFNETLMELPSSISDITSFASTLNSSLATAIEQKRDAQDQIDNFDDNYNIINFTDTFATVENMRELVVDATNFDIGADALPSFQDAVNSVNNIDWSVQDDIITLNTSAVNNMLNSSQINRLRDAENAKTSLLDELQLAIRDIQTYSKGYCSVTTSTLCEVSSDCPGVEACLAQGAKRCKDDPTEACTEDADCTIGDCLIDPVRITSLIVALNAGLGIDLTEETTDLSTVSSSLSGYDVNPLLAEFNTTVDRAGSVSLANITQRLLFANESVDAFDLPTFTSDLRAANNSLSDIDFTSIQNELVNVNNSLNEITDLKPNLIKSFNLTRAFRELFLNEVPSYLTRLDETVLDTLYEDEGMADLVKEVFAVLDDMFEFLDSQSTLIEGLPKIVEGTDSLRERLDKIYGSTFANHGWLYFIFVTSGNEADVVSHLDPLAYRVEKDINGNIYANDTICVLESCIENEIKYQNEEPLDEVTDGQIPIPYSRVEVQSMAYVFPALAALMGLSAMLCGLFGQHKCAHWWAGINAAWIFITIPFIFFFSHLFFTFIIFGADICYSTPTIMDQYMRAWGEDFCVDLIGGNGTNAACTFEIADNFTATLDVNEAWQSVIGVCEAGNDPFYELYSSASTQVGSKVSSEIDKLLDNLDESNLKFRPIVKDVFYNLKDDLVVVLQDFILDLAPILGCSALNDVFFSGMDSFCCDVADAAYWSLGSWCLIAWSFIWCGCGASLCGRKRFGQYTWGRDHDKIMGEYVDDTWDAGWGQPLQPMGDGNQDTAKVAPLIITDGADEGEGFGDDADGGESFGDFGHEMVQIGTDNHDDGGDDDDDDDDDDTSVEDSTPSSNDQDAPLLAGATTAAVASVSLIPDDKDEEPDDIETQNLGAGNNSLTSPPAYQPDDGESDNLGAGSNFFIQSPPPPYQLEGADESKFQAQNDAESNALLSARSEMVNNGTETGNVEMTSSVKNAFEALEDGAEAEVGLSLAQMANLDGKGSVTLPPLPQPPTFDDDDDDNDNDNDDDEEEEGDDDESSSDDEVITLS